MISETEGLAIQNLQFAKRHIQDTCGAHFWALDAKDALTDCDSELCPDRIGRYMPDAQKAELRRVCATQRFPYIYRENETVFHILVEDKCGNLYAAGPFCARQLTEGERNEYAKSHGLSIDALRIPTFSASKITEIASVFCYLVSGEGHSLKSINHVNTVLSDLYVQDWIKFRMGTIDDARISIEEERNWLNSFFWESNPDDLEVRQDPGCVYLGKIPGAALKEEEYKAVIAIALVTRGAIYRGLDAAEGLVFADFYFRQLANSSSAVEYHRIQNRALKGIAGMSRYNWKDGENMTLSARCKQYVEQHLTEHLTVDPIANAGGVSKNYWSHLFAKDNGITLTRFIQEKKMDRASELLRFTNMEIDEISASLEYCSQSHFGKIFKEHFGVTPQKYRSRFQNRLHEDTKSRKR